MATMPVKMRTMPGHISMETRLGRFTSTIPEGREGHDK